MSEQETMRLVAEVVDKYSGPMRDMQKSLRQLSDRTRGVHADGAKQTKAHAKAYEDLGGAISKVVPALGIAGGAALSVSAAIAGVVASVKALGDTSLSLLHVGRQAGLSATQLRSYAEMGERVGISSETMTAGITKFSAFMDANARRAPFALEVWRQMPGSFEAIGQSLRGLSRSDQLKRVFDFIGTTRAPMDQKRKLLGMMGLPEDLAGATKEELRSALREAEEWSKAHPIDVAKGLRARHGFDELRAAVQGLKDDLSVDFAPTVTTAVRALGEVTEATAGGLRELVKILRALRDGNLSFDFTPPKGSNFEALGKYLSDPDRGTKLIDSLKRRKTSFDTSEYPAGGKLQPLTMDGVQKLFNKDDLKNSTKEGATKGVFDGLMQWFSFMRTSATGDGAGGAARVIKASYSPGGSGRDRDAGAGGNVNIPDQPASNLKGSDFLREQRARFADELKNNPQTRKELAALTTLEGNPANVTEALMNRMAMIHGTIAKGMHSGFYGPINRGQLAGAMAALERNPKRMAQVNKAIDEVLAGRNVLRGATDQGMVSDPNGRWPGGRVYGQDQVYNDWGGGPGGHEGARRFREAQQRQVEQGGSSIALHGEMLRKHFGHRSQRPANLLSHAQRAGLMGQPDSLTGNASLDINLNGFPRGTRTATEISGMFKQVRLNRGKPMALASEES